MTEQNTVDIEAHWTVREEQFEERRLIGLQNALPQSHEEEQLLFAALEARACLNALQPNGITEIYYPKG